MHPKCVFSLETVGVFALLLRPLHCGLHAKTVILGGRPFIHSLPFVRLCQELIPALKMQLRVKHSCPLPSWGPGWNFKVAQLWFKAETRLYLRTANSMQSFVSFLFFFFFFLFFRALHLPAPICLLAKCSDLTQHCVERKGEKNKERDFRLEKMVNCQLLILEGIASLLFSSNHPRKD